jgi:hypothetical protein
MKVTLKVDYDAKQYDKATLKEKAEYLLQLKKAQDELKTLMAESIDIFQQDLNDARNGISEAIVMTSFSGSIELPAGYAEKILTVKETESLVDTLKKLDKDVYSDVVLMVPKINKIEVNKLRKINGQVKNVLDKAYSTEKLMPLVFTFEKTI